MFESTLGITLNNQEVLRKAILEAAVYSDQANAIGDNGHGMVYVLRFPLTRANRTTMILTVWGRPGTARRPGQHMIPSSSQCMTRAKVSLSNFNPERPKRLFWSD